MAAQRAAGETDFATLNEQLRPSALRPALPPAANAALVALMQNNSSAAAAISIVNLMARSFPFLIATSCFADLTKLYHQSGAQQAG
jgi:ABC-type arginine/histidine transport system permease subunit